MEKIQNRVSKQNFRRNKRFTKNIKKKIQTKTHKRAKEIMIKEKDVLHFDCESQTNLSFTKRRFYVVKFTIKKKDKKENLYIIMLKC
jgi:hypothetical protein